MSAVLERPRQGSFALQANRVAASWLKQAFGAFALLDLSFPCSTLAAAPPGNLVGIADTGTLPRAEAGFLQRFRAAGGHVPLFGLSTAHEVPADKAWHRPEVTRIVYTEAQPEPALLRHLLSDRAIPWFLLLAREQMAETEAALQAAGYAAAELHITAGQETERYRLLLPAAVLAGAVSALDSAGRDLGLGVATEEGKVPSIRIEAAPAEKVPQQPLLATIPRRI
jgi:hypothetical protein